MGTVGDKREKMETMIKKAPKKSNTHTDDMRYNMRYEA